MKKTVSKKKRILCNLFLILIALWVMDFFTGNFLKLPVPHFRREERGNLLGPSRILGTEEIDHGPFQNLIVADDGDGVILWLWGEDLDRTQLIYREKYTDPLLLAAPGSGSYGFDDEIHVPIVLFDSVQRAARAEIEFTVAIGYNGKEYVDSYILESQRTAQGYFLFTLELETGSALGLGGKGEAVARLVNVSANWEEYPKYYYPVQVRFYDLLGNLIGEETIVVRPASALWLEE